jgi:hypothetical protein
VQPPVTSHSLHRGRFTFVFFPADSVLASTLLSVALSNDSFPGLPRPVAPAVIALAPNEDAFHAWIGPGAPEWGAAVAFPRLQRIVMQGAWAPSSAGDHKVVLRHELAHLALHEHLGNRTPRWFDEGYASFAAGEWKRTDAVAANFLLLVRGTPQLDSLDALFSQGAGVAQAAYILSHVAVENLSALDRDRGLNLFFRYWMENPSMDAAVRRAYGLTLSAFEERWMKSIGRRYGLVSLLGHAGVAVFFLILLLAPLFIRRRRLVRERLAALRKSEAAAERRAVSEALADMLGEGPGEGNGG